MIRLDKAWAFVLFPAIGFCCVGTWKGTSEHWGVGSNWVGCLDSYPGGAPTPDVALFSGQGVQTLTLSDGGGSGISPNLRGVSFARASYTLNPAGVGVSELHFFGPAFVNASTKNNYLNIPLQFENAATHTIAVSQGGGLFFSRETDWGAGNVHATSPGFSRGCIHNKNNREGFINVDGLTINSRVGDSVLFTNINTEEVTAGIGSLIEVNNLTIYGGKRGPELQSLNLGNLSEGAVSGTFLQVASEITLCPTAKKLPRLNIENRGEVIGGNFGSLVTSDTLQGRGDVTISNRGGCRGGQAASHGAVMVITEKADLAGCLAIRNFSSDIKSLSIGAALFALNSDTLLLDHLVVSNSGDFEIPEIAPTAYGAFLEANNLTIRKSAQFINRGNFSENSNTTANGCDITARNLTLIGDRTHSLFLNTGDVAFASSSNGINITLGAFTKGGSGRLTMENRGAIEVNKGVLISHTALRGPIVMSGGSWEIKNSGTISQLLPFIRSYGVLIDAQGPFIMQGGCLRLSNQGTITNRATGAAISKNGRFIQTGGSFLIEKSPPGYVDAVSMGAVLIVSEDSLEISGGCFENNELVLLRDQVDLKECGIVKGEGRFASSSSILPNWASFLLFSNSGRVIPGSSSSRRDSPGVLTIHAPYVQTAQGQLDIHILRGDSPGPCGYSQLNIVGTAALDGTLNLILDPGFSISSQDQLTILQASEGITDQFSSVKVNHGKLFTPVLTYLPQSLLLSFLSHPSPCCKLSCYPGNFTQTLFTSITDTNNFLIKRELQRIQKEKSLAENPDQAHPTTLYFGPTGSFGHSHSQEGQLAFDYHSFGAIVGADHQFLETALGGLLTYEQIHSDDLAADWNAFSIKRLQGSLYGSYMPEKVKNLAIDAIIGGGYDFYSLSHRHTSAHPHGYELDALLGVEYLVTKNAYHIIPMVNLQYIYLHTNSYKEGDGRFSYQAQKQDSLSSLLGVFVDREWTRVTLQANIGWQYEFLNQSRTLHYSGGELSLAGGNKNKLLAGGNLQVELAKQWELQGSYDLIWNPDFSRNSFYLGASRAF